MEIKVLCPSCQSLLRVPSTAAGKVARCPKCQAKFQVPSEKEVMEETVSNWIEQDVEDMEDEFERMYQQRLDDEIRRKHEAEQKKRSQTTQKMHQFLSPSDEPDHAGDPLAAGGVTDTPTPGQRAPRPDSPNVHTAPASASTSGDSDDSRPENPAPSSHTAVADPQAPPEPVEMVDPNAYPTNIWVAPRAPHLIINECSQRGVMFAFDSSFLEHGEFRVSMPIGCAFSNDRERKQLLARPLAFHDQSQGAIRNAQGVEAGHEFRMISTQTPKDVIASMGTLTQLPTPFKFPMPYYVNEEHSNMSLQCSTRRRAEGGTNCRVLIPNGYYALDWLRNINGVCGREYRLLQQDVARLWSGAWHEVEETTRQRLGTWVGFEPGERFQHYFNDAEFGKKDEGLAGVVLTDRRLIYHKYHRSGFVNYADSPKLLMRGEGDFASLIVRTEEGSVKIAMFRFSDLESLIQIMTDVGLHVDMAKT
jgi:DNA-directed RNA polymerase subunit M/transcription elongation factor TFIIS